MGRLYTASVQIHRLYRLSGTVTVLLTRRWAIGLRSDRCAIFKYLTRRGGNGEAILILPIDRPLTSKTSISVILYIKYINVACLCTGSTLTIEEALQLPRRGCCSQVFQAFPVAASYTSIERSAAQCHVGTHTADLQAEAQDYFLLTSLCS